MFGMRYASNEWLMDRPFRPSPSYKALDVANDPFLSELCQGGYIFRTIVSFFESELPPRDTLYRDAAISWRRPYLNGGFTFYEFKAPYLALRKFYWLLFSFR